MVPRGGLSLWLFNRSKINHLTPPQMPALYQANVPMSIVKIRADNSEALDAGNGILSPKVSTALILLVSITPEVGGCRAVASEIYMLLL
jgi:hypothetical protein